VTWIRGINLTFAVLAVLAPVAHVLELPNKLTLDAQLWLSVQQYLYRGWGPLLGGPTELGALFTSLVLTYLRRQSGALLAATVVANCGYAGMLAAFFFINQPVSRAVASWTPTSLPPDWMVYRARWETGHAIAAVLAVVSLVALIRAYMGEKGCWKVPDVRGG
jgi:hypothetical protein